MQITNLKSIHISETSQNYIRLTFKLLLYSNHIYILLCIYNQIIMPLFLEDGNISQQSFQSKSINLKPNWELKPKIDILVKWLKLTKAPVQSLSLAHALSLCNRECTDPVFWKVPHFPKEGEMHAFPA